MDPVRNVERQPLLHPGSPDFTKQPGGRSRISCRAAAGVMMTAFLTILFSLLLLQTLRHYSPPKDDVFFPAEGLQGLGMTAVRAPGRANYDPGYVRFLKAWHEGKELVDEILALEKKLEDAGIVPSKGSASERLQHFLEMRAGLHNVTVCAFILEHVRRVLGECVNSSYIPSYCEYRKQSGCSVDYPYRSFDGSCNNLNNPKWGMSRTAFDRLLKADYADGVALPRVSVLGGRLPNARVLSNALYMHKNRPDSNSTLLFMNFGLFVDHDVVQIGPQTGISCCDHRIAEKPCLRHPECLEIDIPHFDEFYGPHNITCLDFIRSRPVCGHCPGQREQLNVATSYLDGSAVYGSTEEQSKTLRLFHHGLLAGIKVKGTPVLPIKDKAGVACGTHSYPLHCFLAGDQRVNENVELTAMHNLWFREHNRVALALRGFHPEWLDEKLFQEARRIVTAEIQHIAYNEFLPVLVGPKAMEEYGLSIDEGRNYDGYNDSEKANTFNVFAASAFRFGHSMVQSFMDLYDDSYRFTKSLPLHHTFLNPRLIYQGGFDLLLRGMVVQRTQSVETYATPEIRNKLFMPDGGKWGLDLSAFGVQRGRDHGLPSYPAWRQLCNLSAVEKWEDMYELMDSRLVDKMQELYSDVNDVDLTPAALAEHHVEGAMVGPTLTCLISKQFRRFRVADRFWYEVMGKSWSFTKDQLHQLYKSNMARVVCDNADHLDVIQRYAFQAPSDGNPIMKCSELPEVDLSKWA